MIIVPRTLKESPSQTSNITTKHRLRKVILLPLKEEVFIFYKKSTQQISMVNTVALKQCAQGWLQTLTKEDSSNPIDQSSNQNFQNNQRTLGRQKVVDGLQGQKISEENTKAAGKKALNTIVQFLQNEIRERKVNAKYPSDKQQVIEFYIRHSEEKLRLQKQSKERQMSGVIQGYQKQWQQTHFDELQINYQYERRIRRNTLQQQYGKQTINSKQLTEQLLQELQMIYNQNKLDQFDQQVLQQQQLFLTDNVQIDKNPKRLAYVKLIQQEREFQGSMKKKIKSSLEVTFIQEDNSNVNIFQQENKLQQNSSISFESYKGLPSYNSSFSSQSSQKNSSSIQSQNESIKQEHDVQDHSPSFHSHKNNSLLLFQSEQFDNLNRNFYSRLKQEELEEVDFILSRFFTTFKEIPFFEEKKLIITEECVNLWTQVYQIKQETEQSQKDSMSKKRKQNKKVPIKIQINEENQTTQNQSVFTVQTKQLLKRVIRLLEKYSPMELSVRSFYLQRFTSEKSLINQFKKQSLPRDSQTQKIFFILSLFQCFKQFQLNQPSSSNLLNAALKKIKNLNEEVKKLKIRVKSQFN